MINQNICSELQKKKYALISADKFFFPANLETDKQLFWRDWENLNPDKYLENGARFRLRRFCYMYFVPAFAEILPFPPMPYFQSSKLNTYAGDIQREFAPVLNSTLHNKFLHELIKWNFQQLPVKREKSYKPWKVDVHQIRIVTTPDEEGKPTPEGIHRDGEDFVCIHLIKRENVIGGVNTIYDDYKNPLESKTLQQPLDSIILCEPMVMHGVSPIRPKNLDKKAFRDVLLIGYSYDPKLKRPT